MAGISDKAVKTQYAENKYRYNKGTELQNKEFFDGSGLELYTTDHRLYDPQLGRFVQVDAYADVFENWSPYTYATDNPILLNDPSGLMSDSTHPQDRAPAIVTAKKPSSSSSATFADNRPTKRNPDFIFGGNKPFNIPYNQTLPGQWDPAKTKEFVKIAGPAVTLIPVARGLKAIYSIYKLRQYLKEAEFESSLKGKSLKELQDMVKENSPLFRELFGSSPAGSQKVLDNIENVEVPEGLTKEAIQTYRELTTRVVDPVGTQAIRRQILDEILKNM